MHGLLLRADDVLRRRPWTTTVQGANLASLTLLIVVFGLIYGAAMGSYAATFGPSALQILYSGIKVPLLLLATFVLTLPSFFVANTLMGLRRDFGEALRAIVATQAGLSVILASLAPF